MSQSKVNTDAYLEFVNAVTSEQSKDHEAFVYRIQELEGQEFPTERLLTAAVGMSAEAGEFTEIVKKIVFQGKPVNEENLFHMKRELGDIMWYVAQACMGLNTSIDEIIEMNVEKLEKRYPGGSFDVHYSENRKDGDV
jgi:NTP pyrophosphatase (non-canonical NTP hydrolase)